MVAGTSRRNKIFYAFGSIGSGVYSAFNTAILSLYVSAFTSNPYLLGYLSNTQKMEGAVLQPLVGRWSDRMTSPLGRRRPFLLVCVPISLFFLALIPVLGHQSHALALPLIAPHRSSFSPSPGTWLRTRPPHCWSTSRRRRSGWSTTPSW